MQTMRDVIKEAKGTFISAIRRTTIRRWLVVDLGPDNAHTISSLGNEKQLDPEIQNTKHHTPQLGYFLFAVCSSPSFDTIPFSG